MLGAVAVVVLVAGLADNGGVGVVGGGDSGAVGVIPDDGVVGVFTGGGGVPFLVAVAGLHLLQHVSEDGGFVLRLILTISNCGKGVNRWIDSWMYGYYQTN